MTLEMIFNGFVFWIGLVVLLTFHEFGHAWMAMKCGDNTAHDRGRVSLNPLVHIDLIGTVILPLAMIFLSASGSGLRWEAARHWPQPRSGSGCWSLHEFFSPAEGVSNGRHRAAGAAVA